MTIIPVQYFGLGDIIYEQTLVRKIAGNNPILWPVQANYVQDLNRAYPDIVFVDKDKIIIDYNRKDEYEEYGLRYLPLRWADAILKVPYSLCMKSKYDLYNMDFKIWKQNAMWKRDRDAEGRLYRELGCDKGPYVMCNTIFGSDSQLKIPTPELPTGLNQIVMRSVEGYSLFDWALILEHASAIFTVSTSLIYILELLELKTKEINLFVRKPIEKDFTTIDYLLDKHSYKLHL